MAAADQIPAGWLACNGLLQPDTSVAGYLARGQEVTGVCGQRDCKRRCTVDLERLARRGFGALPLDQVKRFLRCQNLTGCGLDFREDHRAGLPLKALFGVSHVRIRVKCGGCGFFRVATPEALWRKVVTDKPDDSPLTSEVAGRVKGPCKQCRKRDWQVDVLWPSANSEWLRRASGS